MAMVLEQRQIPLTFKILFATINNIVLCYFSEVTNEYDERNLYYQNYFASRQAGN